MKTEQKYAGSATLLAAVAAAASSHSAMAADLPMKAAPPPPPVPTWQGLYVGGSIGASWLSSTMDDSAANLFGYYGNGGRSTANALGVIGGLQLGYNWQDRNFVYGIEGDISWLGGNKTTSTSGLVGYSGYATTKTSRIDALSTLRGRFGFDFGGTMPYVTLGLAVGDIKHNYTGPNFGYGTVLSTTNTQWQPGVVVGGGIEHQFANRWSLRAEVLWVGFKDFNTLAPQQLSNGFTNYGAGTNRFSDTLLIGRLGLNYRF